MSEKKKWIKYPIDEDTWSVAPLTEAGMRDVSDSLFANLEHMEPSDDAMSVSIVEMTQVEVDAMPELS